MCNKVDKYFYKRNILISTLLSLCLLIILFYTVPSKDNIYELSKYSEPIITLLDIPHIVPSHQIEIKPATPILSADYFTIETPEILDDVEIAEVINKNEIVVGSNNLSNLQNNNIYESSVFPFIPRQLIEVVPQNKDKISGYIKLKILIGDDGFPKQHLVLENSINSISIVKDITDALYKSRWQVVTIDNEKIEYWIEKIYSFN